MYTTSTASKNLASEATCTEPQKYYYSCIRCGEIDYTRTFSYGEPTGHIFTQVEDPKYLKKEGSLTEKTVYYRPCEKCGYCCDEKIYEIESGLSNAVYGDEVVFGKYEQDGNTQNGAEDIVWIVTDTEIDGKKLLVSKYALDYQPYHNVKGEKVTWETCSLREWLNNNFYNSAFSSKEKNWIKKTTLENKDGWYYNSTGGKSTEDYVFIPSAEEIIDDPLWTKNSKFDTIYINDYDKELGRYFSKYNTSLICEPTKYAISKGANAYVFTASDTKDYKEVHGGSADLEGLIGTMWWIRNPGGYATENDTTRKTFILYYEIGADRWKDETEYLSIRPAIYLDYEK